MIMLFTGNKFLKERDTILLLILDFCLVSIVNNMILSAIWC